jgi:hypothetical protein
MTSQTTAGEHMKTYTEKSEMDLNSNTPLQPFLEHKVLLHNKHNLLAIVEEATVPQRVFTPSTIMEEATVCSIKLV